MPTQTFSEKVLAEKFEEAEEAEIAGGVEKALHKKAELLNFAQNGALKQICRQLISETSSQPNQENRQVEIRVRASELIAKMYPLEPALTHEALLDEVLFSLWGLGSIESLFRDPKITEIMINGPGRVWIEREGELILTELELDSPAIQTLIEKIVSPLGLRVDRSNPQVDARLPDGSRVHIIALPLAVDGPYITIRRFHRRDISLADFISNPISGLSAPDTHPQDIIDFLIWAVKERLNIVVSGGTSSGKTTFLNALINTLSNQNLENPDLQRPNLQTPNLQTPNLQRPDLQRIVTIEDTAELCLKVKNLVRLEARQNSEGVGEVTQRDLVKTALRMRPDRILLGEVRGAEALDMIQAMNTGNAGSLSTCHANSAKSTLTRLETMMLMAGSGLNLQAVREQIKSAVDLIIYLERTPVEEQGEQKHGEKHGEQQHSEQHSGKHGKQQHGKQQVERKGKRQIVSIAGVCEEKGFMPIENLKLFANSWRRS